MEPVEQGFGIWKEYGFAGLFVFVFLFLLTYLLWQLNKVRNESNEMTERVVTALDNAAAVQRELKGVLDTVKTEVHESGHQTSEFLVYLKARDQFFGGSRQ